MKKVSNTNLKDQTREVATLALNATEHNQNQELFFVQFDDFYAVGSDGCIYQMIPKNQDLENPILVYESEEYNYNYAEDSDDFEEDSEDREIFEHCKNQAELNAFYNS